MKRLICTILGIFFTVVLSGTTLWADQWKISFNDHPGIMELSKNQNNYAGRFNLHGNWEEMLDLRVYRNAIFFRRAAADQKYLGIMEGNRMQGIFSQGGSGSYPWIAQQINDIVADPFISDSGFLPVNHPTGRAVSNLALGKTVRQSSTGYGGVAGHAVDGNRNGNYSANSVSHTNNNPQEWWEVDLGQVQQISEIKLWNRTDCCGERLSNFYVLVSSRPFPAGTLTAVLSDSTVWQHHIPRVAGRETTIPISTVGRYVRIQLAGQNWLSLAEVEILGTDSSY